MVHFLIVILFVFVCLWCGLCQYPLVKPVVTPRFAPSCTEALLGQLGAIAKNNNLHIQVSSPWQPNQSVPTGDCFHRERLILDLWVLWTMEWIHTCKCYPVAWLTQELHSHYLLFSLSGSWSNLMCDMCFFLKFIYPESHQWKHRGSEAREGAVSWIKVLHWCLLQKQPAHWQGEYIDISAASKPVSTTK